MIEANFFSNLMNSKKRVLLRAPVLTQSGYGVHSRQIAKWLLSKPNIDLQVQALMWGDTPWIIDRSSHDGLIGSLMDRSVDPQGQIYDATVQVQLPNEWSTSFSSTNIGISAVVETDICSPSWIDACNQMTAVVVPSTHCKNVLDKSGIVIKPLFVIPESYPDELRKDTQTKIDDINFDTSFNFLMVGQITGKNSENDRKNIFYTIKWFCEAFNDDDDVGLVIKTNAGRNTKIDRQVVTGILSSVLREINKKKSPKVYLLHGDMSDAEMASLYRHKQIKGLITLTRGEGFGLPILEAAASGLPVIATGWSGHMDFLSLGKFINVNYKIEPVHESRIDNAIFVRNSKWANVVEEDFKKKIIKFRNSSSLPKQWADELKVKIQQSHSFESISNLYESSLGQFL